MHLESTAMLGASNELYTIFLYLYDGYPFIYNIYLLLGCTKHDFLARY